MTEHHITQLMLPYDRSQVNVGIVHIGAGRFHRAHQALYCQELLTQGDRRWGISAAFVLPSDRSTIDAMREQQCMYTLVERDASGETPKVMGSIVEVLDGYTSPHDVINRIADPSVKLVTFTVTEAGYFFDPSTKRLLLDHPPVRADIKTTDSPKTLYGFLALGLAQRLRNGLGPVTIQSCDNIQGNGDLVRSMLLEFLSARDAQHQSELASWVSEYVTFPNSMVDRITPAADPQEQARAQAIFKCEDQLAVTAERYRQWVIEDNYCNDQPDWASVGVEVVDSVKPYEKIKIRLLNAGHSAICYAGYLADLATIGEIVQNPLLQQYLYQFFKEVEPTLNVPEGMDVQAYQHKLVERFMNPAIVDQTLRICKDGSSKIPGFIVPTLRQLLAANLPTGTFSFFFASYYAFLEHQLATIGIAGIDDTQANTLEKLVEDADGDLKTFFADETIFGDLAQHETFISDCQRKLTVFKSKRSMEALSTLLHQM